MHLRQERRHSRGRSADDSELLRVVLDAVDRLRLSETQLAALCGFSVPVATAVCRRGQLPKQPRCQEGLRAFARRAVATRSRSEWGLP